MKKWTRLLAILLMLGMLLSLAACGSKDADKVVRELVNEDADAILLKDFASPLEFYRAVEQRRADELLGLTLGSSLLQNLNAEGGFFASELLLALDQSVLKQDLLDLVTEAAGMDLSWVQSLSLAFNTGRSENLSQGKLALRLNGTDIIHMDVIMDNASMTEYMAIPELNESYCSVNLLELLDDYSPVGANELLDMFSGSETAAEGLDMLQRYYKLVLDNLTKVEVSDGSVSAGGLTCKCSVAKVTIEAEDVQRIGNAVLDAAAQDKDMEALVYRSMKLSGDFSGNEEDFHSKYADLIRDAKTDLEDLDDSGSILMTVYIDAKGEILGRSIEGLSEGERVLLLSFLTARDGDKMGVDVEFNIDNKYETWETQTVVKASGSGTYSSETGKLTGDYLVSYYYLDEYRGEREEKDLELFNVNVDLTLGREGLLGQILMTPCDDLINLVLEELGDAPAPVVDLVRSLSLALVNRSGDGKLDSALILRTEGQDLLTLSLTAAPAEAFEISIPTDTVDMDTWTSSIGFGALSTIMANLRNAGVPASLFNSLMG